MIRRLLTNLRIENAHPPDEKLLSYVDNELSTRHAAKLKDHLGTCWSCRSHLDKIEETISLFVEFRSQIQSPLTPAPPRHWGGFDGDLAAIATVPTPRSFWTEVGRLWNDYFEALRPANWSSAFIRAFSGSVAAVVIVALVWQLLTVRPVAATELLDKAVAAENEAIARVSQPVVYSRIRFQRQNAESFDWEVWRDLSGGRHRQTLGENNKNSLAAILSANAMSPLEPLSASSYRKWRDSVTDKKDEVVYSQNERAETLLSVRTVDNGPKKDGQIARATLTVREGDWHPTELDLHVTRGGTEENLRFTEIEFAIVSISTLDRDFFGSDTTSTITTTSSANPQASENPSPAPQESTNSNTAVDAPTLLATAEDEVEILRLLNQARADLGEQITVKRQDGLLHIRGVVETAQRKSAIVSALKPVANNPAVRIEIETYAEASARQAQKKSDSAIKQEVLGADNQQAAAENELVERLGTTAEARIFSTRMVERSWRAMNHAYALRRLSRQFTAEQLRQMKPEARAKWLSLVASHAGAFRLETAELRSELQRVFGTEGSGVSPVPSVGDWADVSRAVERLVDLGSANDHVIRSAFAVSSEGARFSAVKTSHFWQSLRAAEVLAGNLQRMK